MSKTPSAVLPFCAICTDEIPGDPRKAPIGRNGAMVHVCDDCYDEPATEARDHQYGYTKEGTKGSTKDLLIEAMDRVGVPRGNSDDNRVKNSPMYTGVEHGHVMRRVNRTTESGRHIDQRTAYEIARTKWGPDVQFVAGTTKFYIYQVPLPSKIAPGGDPIRDPIRALTPFQRKTP